jgi:hypothetical protein
MKDNIARDYSQVSSVEEMKKIVLRMWEHSEIMSGTI